jgi:hypothetical protein
MAVPLSASDEPNRFPMQLYHRYGDPPAKQGIHGVPDLPFRRRMSGFSVPGDRRNLLLSPVPMSAQSLTSGRGRRYR